MAPQSLPPSITSELERAGISTSEVALQVPSDISPDGNYGTQWLISAGGRILVVGPSGLLRNIGLKEVQSARVEPLVGSARLEVTVDGEPIPLIQFSNALSSSFARACRYLENAAKGKPQPAHLELLAETTRCRTCNLMLPEATQVCPRCLKKGRVLMRLLQLVHPYRYRCAIILALLMTGTSLEMAYPQVTRVLIDEVLRPPGQPELLLTLVLCLLGLRVAQTILHMIGTRLTNRVGALLVTDLRARLFRRLQEMTIQYYDKAQVGALMTRVGQDTEELRIFISHAIQGVLQQVLLVTLIGFTLFAMSPSLGLFVLAPAPLVIFSTVKFWNYLVPHINRYWAQRSALNSTLNAAFSGIRVVKAFAQETREVERFDARNLRLLSARQTLDVAWLTFSPWVGFVFGLGGLLVWYFGGRNVLAGLSGEDKEAISVGTLLAFIGYIAMFYNPLATLAGVSDWLTRSLTSAQRIFEVLDHPQEEHDAPDALPLSRVRGDVEWQSVSFGYEKNNPVLKDISFQAHAGEMIGIVGRSGAGKTTLMNLLGRFYDVTEGTIRVDGLDVRKVRTRDLRQQIGMVLQEPFLFAGSIAENIGYARPGAARHDIIAAAKAANAHDFIVKLPEGYDTRLGERGAGLSGGERQRVSIARTILHDPAILILDEATSSVDTETEKLIQDALSELVRGRTTFAIAHRLSTLVGAHRILVIDKGTVAELGTPDELMAKRGIYHKLVTIQQQMAKGGRKAASLDELMDESTQASGSA